MCVVLQFRVFIKYRLERGVDQSRRAKEGSVGMFYPVLRGGGGQNLFNSPLGKMD